MNTLLKKFLILLMIPAFGSLIIGISIFFINFNSLFSSILLIFIGWIFGYFLLLMTLRQQLLGQSQ